MRAINRRQAIGLTVAASSVCFAPAYAQSLGKPKIAFVLNLPEGGEFGWSYEHTRGIQQARAAHGNDAQIDAFYEVPEWGNGEKEFFKQLVDDDYQMIFPTSGGYFKSTVEAAQEFPDTLFESCTGYIRAKNMSTYGIRWYEGRTVQGFLAGTMSKTNRVGYIASYPIPEVIRGINAAYTAARRVNPEITFDIVWLNSWFDIDKEGETARQLIERGADVLMQHTNTTAPIEVAQEKGVYGFGQGSDMRVLSPDATMTSVVNNWGPYYTRRIGDLLAGNWASTETWGGLSDEMVAIAPLLETLPSRTVLQTNDLISRLSSGEDHAFVGPIGKQDRSRWLAPGEIAGDSELLTMDYYVEGISSVFPLPI